MKQKINNLDCADKMTKLSRRVGECLEWQGPINPNGYGHAPWSESRFGTRLAHRVQWILCNGQIPKGMCVCHKCDNRKCINPSHLFLGTQRDNVLDMVSKKRNADRRGDKHPLAKLSLNDVSEIRRRWALYPKNQRSLAAEYKIGQAQISRIVTGANWSAE